MQQNCDSSDDVDTPASSAQGGVVLTWMLYTFSPWAKVTSGIGHVPSERGRIRPRATHSREVGHAVRAG
jgi:hypothetical protein